MLEVPPGLLRAFLIYKPWLLAEGKICIFCESYRNITPEPGRVPARKSAAGGPHIRHLSEPVSTLVVLGGGATEDELASALSHRDTAGTRLTPAGLGPVDPSQQHSGTNRNSSLLQVCDPGEPD